MGADLESAISLQLPRMRQRGFRTAASRLRKDIAEPEMNDTTQSNTPQGRYTTYTWGDKLVGVYAQGVGHSVPMRGADDMKFFGL